MRVILAVELRVNPVILSSLVGTLTGEHSGGVVGVGVSFEMAAGGGVVFFAVVSLLAFRWALSRASGLMGGIPV